MSFTPAKTRSSVRPMSQPDADPVALSRGAMSVTHPVAVIACYNRCLICGRQTPHEVCHRHSTPMDGRWPSSGPSGQNFSRNMSRLWNRWFDREAEVCDDEACPQLLHDWASDPRQNGCCCMACEAAGLD